MGDPRKARKQYSTPSHPWQRMRMENETAVRKKYGVKTKREIWKMDSIRKGFTGRAKLLIAGRTEQSKKEKEQIVQKLMKLGMISVNAKFDDILGLTLDDVMERRLQTLVWKKGFAKSPDQARQFITHGHIAIAGKKITSPSYLVSVSEEVQVGFLPKSTLADPENLERQAVAAKPKVNPHSSDNKGHKGRRDGRKPRRQQQSSNQEKPKGADKK